MLALQIIIIRLLQLFVLRNIGVGIVDVENLGPPEILNVKDLRIKLIFFNVYIEDYEGAVNILMPTNAI